MEKLSQVLKSRTVLMALAQALAGVLIVILTEMNEVGYVALVKSAMDIVLRLDTQKPVNEL